MTKLAIIGGSGFTKLPTLEILRREVVHTPYGEPSAPLTHGRFGEVPVVFLPRHGAGHTIPPHKINYRANIWALKQVGATKVVGVAAVGGIREDILPGDLAIPDQIIDYTYSRGHTFFEEDLTQVTHIDFTYPYCEEMRQALIDAAASLEQPVVTHGTYGATQGPRLETAREVDRLERDGCDIVGMTGMPEASLAREQGLCYAHCAVVANRAAGRGKGFISMAAIEEQLELGMKKVRVLLAHLVERL